MTKEELKEHCEKQMEMCELWAISQGEGPSGKVYEEHKLILELLEQEPCEDAIHRDRTVQDFADKCRECGREKVLDKIMEEIEQVKSIMNEEIINNNRKDLINFVNGLNQSFVIVEKYKAESEDKHISGKEQKDV